MIIIPTMGRPANLARFFEACHATKVSLPFFVVFDKGDPELPGYAKLRFPSNFKKIGVPPGTRLGDIYNAIFAKYPDEEYYAGIADDVVPETEHWDVKLKEACMPDKIAWGPDTIKDEALATHPFIGGDLVRKMGWLACPGIKHWYVDNVWTLIAEKLPCKAYRPDVKMPHYHPSKGQADTDITYQNQPSHKKDKQAYQRYCRDELPALLERLAA